MNFAKFPHFSNDIRDVVVSQAGVVGKKKQLSIQRVRMGIFVVAPVGLVLCQPGEIGGAFVLDVNSILEEKSLELLFPLASQHISYPVDAIPLMRPEMEQSGNLGKLFLEPQGILLSPSIVLVDPVKKTDPLPGLKAAQGNEETRGRPIIRGRGRMHQPRQESASLHLLGI